MMSRHAAPVHPATRIRVGIGGWNFPDWRGGAFYPKGLAASQELHFASRALTMIEVNATYYATQSPTTFARWHGETPEDFVFAVKAHRLATHRKSLAEGAEAVVHFIDSGITELKHKLGPIVWQLPPFRRFDADDVECFFALLPDAADGLPLRHVLEPRHPSFACAEYLALARSYGVATVATDSPEFPQLFDPTADFIYARLMQSDAAQPAGYADAELERWAARARAWQRGALPGDLPLIDARASRQAAAPARDVFIAFISGAKARNPAAAPALIARLGACSGGSGLRIATVLRRQAASGDAGAHTAGAPCACPAAGSRHSPDAPGD